MTGFCCGLLRTGFSHKGQSSSASREELKETRIESKQFSRHEESFGSQGAETTPSNTSSQEPSIVDVDAVLREATAVMRPQTDTSRHTGDAHALEVVPFRTLLSEIQLEERLGSGAGGTTWKCRWRTTTVAIKLMVSNSVDELRSTTREAVCSRACSHPYVVQCYAIHITRITDQDLEPQPIAPFAAGSHSTSALMCLGTSPTVASGPASYRQQHFQSLQRRPKRQMAEPGAVPARRSQGAGPASHSRHELQLLENDGKGGETTSDTDGDPEGDEPQQHEHQQQQQQPRAVHVRQRSLLGCGPGRRPPAESPILGRTMDSTASGSSPSPAAPPIYAHGASPRKGAPSPPVPIPAPAELSVSLEMRRDVSGVIAAAGGGGGGTTRGNLQQLYNCTGSRSRLSTETGATAGLGPQGGLSPPNAGSERMSPLATAGYMPVLPPVPPLPMSVPYVNVGPANASAVAVSVMPHADLSSHRPSSVAWWGDASESLLLDGDPGDQAAALRDELVRLGAAPGKFLTAIIMEWCDGGTLHDEFTVPGPPQPPMLRRACVAPLAAALRQSRWEPSIGGGRTGRAPLGPCCQAAGVGDGTAVATAANCDGVRAGPWTPTQAGAVGPATGVCGHSAGMLHDADGGASTSNYLHNHDLSSGVCAPLACSPPTHHMTSQTTTTNLTNVTYTTAAVPTTTTNLTNVTGMFAAVMVSATPSSALSQPIAGAGPGFGRTLGSVRAGVPMFTARSIPSYTPSSLLPGGGGGSRHSVYASPESYDRAMGPASDRLPGAGRSSVNSKSIYGGAGGGPPGNRGRLAVLLRCALEVAQGMSYLHSLNLAHGDLTPKNVLLKSTATSRRGYNCKISDFGLSNPTAAGECLPVDTSRWGTLVYMAPEIFNGGGTLKQADVYSFGALLWHMATGRPPYQELRPAQVLVGLSTGELHLVWPDWVDPAVVRIGRACMHPVPAKRPQFEDIVRMLLAEIAVRSRTARRRAKGKQSSAAGAPPGCGTDFEPGGAVFSGAQTAPPAGQAAAAAAAVAADGSQAGRLPAPFLIPQFHSAGGLETGFTTSYDLASGQQLLSPPQSHQSPPPAPPAQQQPLQASPWGPLRPEPWAPQLAQVQPLSRQSQQQPSGQQKATASAASRCCEWQPVEMPLPSGGGCGVRPPGAEVFKS